ncbi:MAG: hypothetical protein ACRC9E_09040 [Plesiomonas shigelloides]
MLPKDGTRQAERRQGLAKLSTETGGKCVRNWPQALIRMHW